MQRVAPRCENARDHPRWCLASRLLPENPLSARAGLVSGQHASNQRSELGSVQPRESHQTGIQLLQLCLRKRVEIDATNTLLCPRPLQPTEEDLGGTRIGDCALSQATFDLPSEEGSRSLRVARHMGINEVRLQVDGGAGVPACPHRPTSGCPRHWLIGDCTTFRDLQRWSDELEPAKGFRSG